MEINIHYWAIILVAKKKTNFKCNSCGDVWETIPERVLRGANCPVCSRKHLFKTHEQFIVELKEKHGEKLIPLDIYKTNSTPVKMKCNTCNYEWQTQPHALLQGKGCPDCGGTRKLTNEEFLTKLKSIHGDKYIPLEQYKSRRAKMNVLCNDCGYTWSVRAGHLLNGQGCPSCYTLSQRKTNEEFILELKEVHGDKYIALEEYKTIGEKIKMKCSKCNHQWKAEPSNILRGGGCPKCNNSKGENKISDILTTLKIQYKIQYKIPECKNIRPLPFDFGILDSKCKLLALIEYDGEHHYKAIDRHGGEERLKLNQKRDKIKDDFCTNNGIPLLRIPYWEFDLIEERLNEFLNLVTKKKDNGV